MLKFGRTNVPRFASVAEVMGTLVNEGSVNYSLLMPIILFLHSISSPIEVIGILIAEYKRAKIECNKTNCLVILICWLRESSSQFDFQSPEARTQLQGFLTEILSIERINPQLAAAARKLQSQLATIIDEQLDLSACLDIYSTELKPLFAPAKRSKPKQHIGPSSSERNTIGSQTVSEVSSDSSTSTKQLPWKDQKNNHILSGGVSAASFSFESNNSNSSNDVDSIASQQFPDLDRLGRPKSKPKEEKSIENDSGGDFKKPSPPTTNDEIWLEIKNGSSMLKKFESPLELAMHLTFLELHCGVLTLRPREFTSRSWTQASLKQIHPDMGGSSHLHRYIHDTNQRILWLAKEVLLYGWEMNSLKQALHFLIQVAESSYQLNNFNTVSQVVEALKLPAIKRLSAWKTLPEYTLEVYEELCAFCDSSHNFANYRKHLRNLGSQARIPCLSILLKDISFIEMSHPWKVTVDGAEIDGTDDRSSCILIDLQKMESLFRLLCREVFSLSSPSITSFYTSRILCQVHLPEQIISSCSNNTHIARERRGRASRVDNRQDSTESLFLNESGSKNNQEANKSPIHENSRLFQVASCSEYGESNSEDEEDGENNSFNGNYVMICMSPCNGAMEENFFNNCCVQPPHAMDHFAASIPMPISQFFTLTSYLPVPLFFLKMKKHMQGQEKRLDLKIQQQMVCDIRTRLASPNSCNTRRRISVGDDERRASSSPLKKKSPQKNKNKNMNNTEYPEPLATIPHNMSIVSQDAVQSYAQCIDDELFTVTTHLDIPIAEPDTRNEDKNRLASPKKKTMSFSFFGGNCGGEKLPHLYGNRVANMILTAYDIKVIKLYRETASVDTNLIKLWGWSKIIDGDEKSRLLGGLANAGLA